MSRTTLACCCLIASAFVLAAMLLTNLHGRFSPWTSAARASMVASGDNYNFLSAMTRTDEDSLFVIDSREQRLIIYGISTKRDRIEPLLIRDLASIFQQRASTGAAAPAETPRPENQRPDTPRRR
ncbi:MAG: hypothetical protein IT443_11250 [Phycisphaeraceae bacterium]|nr:hypothetical protein [Phycisphaeraceae bacterium]